MDPIDPAELRKQRRRKSDRDIAEYRQHATRTQQLGGLGKANLRRDPVERLRRGNELESQRLRRPVLESRLYELDVLKVGEALPRHPQEFGAGIERQHVQSLPQETPRRLSRAATKLENRIV